MSMSLLTYGSTAHRRSGSDVLQAFTTNVITLLKDRGG